MNPEDLKRILDALTDADVREFTLKTGSFDLALKRGPQPGPAGLPAPAPIGYSGGYAQSAPAPQMLPAAPMGFAPAPAPSSEAQAPSDAPAAPSAQAAPQADRQPEAQTSAQPGPQASAPAPAAAPAPVKGTPIKAPIVGTFYSASSPDAPPYVKVGDTVQAGQVLCIIEAMKLMNEIEAETSGVVRQVLVQNAEPVEYGQTLFMIE